MSVSPLTASLPISPSVAMCLFNGLAQGTQPLISESYGKGDHTQSRQFLTWGVIACLIVEALILVLTWSMTDPLIQIFNQEQNAELLALRPQRLRLYFLGFLFAGINILLVAYFPPSRSQDQPSPVLCCAGPSLSSPALSHWRAVWAERRLAVFPGVRK